MRTLDTLDMLSHEESAGHMHVLAHCMGHPPQSVHVCCQQAG